MKKLITLSLLVLSSLVSSVSANDWDKIRIGVEGAYPPFSSVDKDGTLKGFDIDIAWALCKEIGAECVLVHRTGTVLYQLCWPVSTMR